MGEPLLTDLAGGTRINTDNGPLFLISLTLFDGFLTGAVKFNQLFSWECADFAE